ncbi:MAG: glycosyl transferase, family 2 [Herbinix sp.]|jgi:hypothetical protein|nr:glycosyl transferase, family 2 [Herbinix sp.]
MDRIIVSLTTYPARIATVNRVIKTLLIQNLRPNKILLWLATSQFPEKENDLPPALLELQKYGLEICWCKDIKSHKKYYYAMQDYPEDIIITVDDDIYYQPVMTQLLYDSYLKFPKAISCLRANLITRASDGGMTLYEFWDKGYLEVVGEPVVDLLAVGMGGVLYPPHIMPNELFDDYAVETVCPCQDDLWLKAMELKAEVPVVLAQQNSVNTLYIEDTQKEALFSSVNKQGNDEAIKSLCQYLLGKDWIDRDEFDKLFMSSNTVEMKLSQRRNISDHRKGDFLANKVVLYGIGAGAKTVYDCMKLLMPQFEPYCFVVTKKIAEQNSFLDYPVREIAELPKDVLIVVTTAGKYHEDISETLKKFGFTNVYLVNDQTMGFIMGNGRRIMREIEMFLGSLRRLS